MPERMSDDRDWFEGHSEFLQWAPRVFVAMAVFVLAAHVSHAIEFAVTFVLLAFAHSRWLPWRFEIDDDGLRLAFPFGRRLFMRRDVATVRVDVVGAMVYDQRRGRRGFGYPLLDGILYRPGNEATLRSAFTAHGYRIVEGRG